MGNSYRTTEDILDIWRPMITIIDKNSKWINILGKIERMTLIY
jgi:hypothetical protein